MWVSGFMIFQITNIISSISFYFPSDSSIFLVLLISWYLLPTFDLHNIGLLEQFPTEMNLLLKINVFVIIKFSIFS